MALAFSVPLFSATGYAQLIISEFMADNDAVLQDVDGEYSDWIEIHNTSTSTVNLAGWHLTDDPNELMQWTFPSTNIAANGYVLVFASGKNRATPGQELHTIFSLQDGGEYLGLVDPATNIVSEFRDEFPKQYRDISYGYQTEGPVNHLRVGEHGYLINHTPGAANTNWPAPHPLYADESAARIDLFIAQSDWNDLNNTWAENEHDITFRFRHGDIDVTVSNVAIKPRGNSSIDKLPRSFLISFNGYVPGQDLFGVEKLNLNSEVNDPTTARSKIVNEIVQAAGLPGSYANHAATVVNFTNGSMAVFFDAVRNNTQPVDDIMMKRQFGSSAANLYKCVYRQWRADLTYRGPTGSSYVGSGDENLRTYQLKYQGGIDGSFNDLAEFIDLINNTPANDFANEILARFEVDDFLKRMAIDVLTGHWDDYWFNYNNYYLFDNPARGKWTMVPYDFDNTLGIDWVGLDWTTRDIYSYGSVNTSEHPLISRILAVPEFKDRYSYYMKEILETVYTSTGLAARAHAIRSTLTAPLPFGSPTVTNMKSTERSNYSWAWPYWEYYDFFNGYDTSVAFVVPDDTGVIPFFGARVTSALSQLVLTNIAPVITSFSFEPSLPAIGDAITVRIEAFDDVSNIIADFLYSFNGGSYTSAQLQSIGGNFYEVTLPAFTTNGVLNYYVRVVDETGRVTYEPYGGSNYAYSVNIDSAALNLAITELNYHPYPPEGAELGVSIDEDDYEFIELRNTGSSVIDLFNFQLTDAISFVFPSISLAPGAFVIVVKSNAAFEARYGITNIVAGEYTGKLSDAGEQVRLLDNQGREISVFTYSDGGSWPGRADGRGSSLEVIDTQGDYDSSGNWRSSAEFGGTVGYIGTGPDNRIVVNEVLTHTDLPLVDTVEFYNTTEAAIDISNWAISDNDNNYRKYIIPPGTVISANGYLVFDETNHFNKTMGASSNDFSFNSYQGDDVWLLETDAATNLLRFVDHVDFGAAKNAESFGRWPNGSGSLYPMISRTFGTANSGPRVGPVVISEIMYNTASSNANLEFVEIYNGSTGTVDLTNWELSKGVDYRFPSNLLFGVGEVIVVLPFDPANPVNVSLLNDFITTYSVDTNLATLLGAYDGALSAGGETVELLRPDSPPLELPAFIPMLLEDQVKYEDTAPWPSAPDGTGPSLSRINPSLWGNDPASWRGDMPGSPGLFILSNAWALTVYAEFGTAVPAAGLHVYSPGSTITASVEAVDIQGPVRYSSAGWAMNGQTPSAGFVQSFVFSITNNASLTWIWTTNYMLTATSTVGGTVSTLPAQTWFNEGAVVSVDASPATSNVFVQWVGDTASIVSGSPSTTNISVAMNGPVAVTAVFASAFFDLTIISEYGSPTPAAGTTNLPNGGVINASVQPVIHAGDVQYANNGWVMSGAINGAGSSNAVSFTLSGNQTLAWLWVTNTWLEIVSGEGGGASSSRWVTLGGTAAISAAPDAGFRFFRWTGDTGIIVSGNVNSASIEVSMNEAARLEAEFCLIVNSTNNLLRNPSFEVEGSTSEEAYYWESGNPDFDGANIGTGIRADWRSHEGSWQATIRGTWALEGDFGQWWQLIPVQPNVTYTLNGWFYQSADWGAGSQYMLASYRDATNGAVGLDFTFLTSLGTFWQQRTLVTTAPTSAVSMLFAIAATDVGGSGALQFDDLSVTASTCLNVPELDVQSFNTTYQVLSWDSVGGAVYAIRSSTNLAEGFADLTNGIPATPPVNVFTNMHPGENQQYYQLQSEAAQ